MKINDTVVEIGQRWIYGKRNKPKYLVEIRKLNTVTVGAIVKQIWPARKSSNSDLKLEDRAYFNRFDRAKYCGDPSCSYCQDNASWEYLPGQEAV